MNRIEAGSGWQEYALQAHLCANNNLTICTIVLKYFIVHTTSRKLRELNKILVVLQFGTF